MILTLNDGRRILKNSHGKSFLIVWVNDMNKVGRNDLCPCGSGKKFKKCCLDNPTPIQLSRQEDDALGQQRIREYEEEQKKQDWSKPLEPLPVINSDLPLFEPLAIKGRIQI